MLAFSVLGPLEVRRDGVRLTLGPRRHTEVLALLVTRPRTVVPVEALADQLWQGTPPATATNTLQGYISGLRRALEPERGAREPARVLVTHPVGYRLDVEDDALDVAIFRARVAEARRLAGQSRVPEALTAVREALALWRGPALADVADTGWARPVIRALEEERLAAEDLLVDLRLAGDEIEDLVADLRRHLAADPLRERRAAQLMRVLYRTGRQAEALDVARETRTTLEEQLGIDPGPELRELELAILRQDDSVLLPRPGPASPAPPVPHAPVAGRLPGRAAELAVLGAAGATARAGTTTVVLVVGEAGIGKTRLVQEAIAALPGFRVLTGRCSNLEGTPPYWPWRQVLALLGPTDSPPVRATDLVDAEGIVAGRFEQALRLTRRLRSVAEDQPVALLLDDVQWGDAPSLQLLELVLDQLVGAAVLIILTSRVVGSSSPYPLTRLLATLARHPSAQRVHLSGLDEEAIQACVAEVTGREPTSAAVAEVHRRSSGNPYFARELARLLDGDVLRPGVPAAVRDVIRMRTAALGAGTRELLAAGAVLGRDFSVPTVQDVLGVDAAALVPVIEETLDAGLLVEPVAGRLRFEHALVHEAIREDLSAARALTLHARAAQALSRRERPPLGVLAHHLLQAQDPRGFQTAVQAAEEDLAQLAVEPALTLVDQALALTDLVPADPAVVRALRLLRGLALGRLGRLDEGRAELVRVALGAEAALHREQLARASLAMAGDGAVSGYWTTMAPVSETSDDVVTWLRHSLDGGSRADLVPTTRVALRSALATQLAVTGRPDRALADAAAAEAETLDRHSRIRAMTARWATLWTPDHAAERLQIATALLELAGPDIPHQLAARHLLAHALLEVGDLAGSDHQAALLAETETRHRNPDFALLVLWWRSMRALMSGDLTRAEGVAEELAAELDQAVGRAAATATLSLRTVSGIVAWERGQLGRVAAQLDVQGFTSHPGMEAVRALAHADNDDPAAAHRVLHDAFGPRLEKLGTDSTALAPLVLGAEALARAGDDGRAALFLERLRPYAHAVIVFAPGAVCMGAGTLYTGTTAALSGDLTRARTDLEDAVERNRALGADPFTMRSLHRLAAVLARTGDADRAAARLREAQEIARRRGLALGPQGGWGTSSGSGRAQQGPFETGPRPTTPPES